MDKYVCIDKIIKIYIYDKLYIIYMNSKCIYKEDIYNVRTYYYSGSRYRN